MNKITLTGKIIFDPINLTVKHKKQAGWKRVAFIEFNDDSCEYYQWFIMRRYNLILNKSIRLPHVTIINDSIKDLTKDGSISIDDIDKKWFEVKNKWNGKTIDVKLDVDVRSDGFHWWLNVPNEDREDIQNIRDELGLLKPYWGFILQSGTLTQNMKNIQNTYID